VLHVDCMTAAEGIITCDAALQWLSGCFACCSTQLLVKNVYG